ncbi:hypothetical protein [Sphaerisporangium aureirubrum]|uniref:Lipoprotein n=1 Tax=Sphaerisporangium aureirubrum TaxID=1544736 RepID=A0ABW1NTB5_9ACTN
MIHLNGTRPSGKRFLGFATVVLAGSCALVACTGDPQGAGGTAAATKDSGVASLATATATPGNTPKASPSRRASDGGRPQLRLDSSPEEITRFRQAYAACLRKHGMPESGEWTAAREKAGRKACEDKMPLLPPEMDPRTNPHYADAVRTQVKCLKERGLKARLVPAPGSDPGDVSWTLDSLPGEDVDLQDIQDDCREKAFGGGRALAPGPM